VDHVLTDGVSLPSPLTQTVEHHGTHLQSGITLSSPTLTALPSFSETPFLIINDPSPTPHDAIGVNNVSLAPPALTEPAKISEGTSQMAGHMTIDVVAAAGASFSNAASAALHYAAIYLGNLITDPIAVTIQANVSNLSSTPSLQGVLAFGSAKGYYENFKTVRNEIALHDPSVAKYLPTSLPSGVYTSMVASKSELQAWGISYTAAYSIGGSIVINTAYSSSFNYSTSITSTNAGNGTDFVGVAEHELSHALGRISYNGNTASNGQYLFGPLNLFRFDSPGKLQVDGISSSSNATIPYFSLNGGKKDLISFASVSRTDWANLASGTRYSNDAWDGYAPSSGYARIYNFDRSLLNVIGFDVNCFAAGTRILLRRGEVAVENLAIGDEVVLASGGTVPIRWIGQRRVNATKHPKPDSVWPILIKAGAILDGVPARDLLVSPDHALFLDGHLIQAKTLLNGSTIRQVPRKRITYYHIELPTHAVLLAEGTPAESYLDTGNRTAFENAGIAVSLHPDFAPPDFAPVDAQALRIQQSCAPFIESGPVVEQIRARILARAAIATTNDPAITIETTPNGDSLIRSRHAIPGLLAPDPRDRRTLGVKILSLHAGPHKIPLDHPLLTEGWHNPEPDGRWTNGRAIIPAALHRGNPITLTLAATLNYPTTPAQRSEQEQKSLSG
jgi:hypothetical protein